MSLHDAYLATIEHLAARVSYESGLRDELTRAYRRLHETEPGYHTARAAALNQQRLVERLAISLSVLHAEATKLFGN